MELVDIGKKLLALQEASKERHIADCKPLVQLIYLHVSGSINHNILTIDSNMLYMALKFGKCTW